MARLIDADAMKKEWHLGNVCETCGRDTRQCWNDYCFSRMDVCGMIDDAPTVGGWISVKDRLPEKYFDVLVLVQYPKVNGYTGHYVVIAWKSTDDDSWDSDNDNFNNDPEGVVTHWMPLPEPPEENEDD